MSRIRWLINRVRVMSAPEVLFRIRRSFANKREKSRVAAGWRPLPDVPVKPGCPLFGDNDGIVDKWMQSFQLDDAALGDYLAGRMKFFGHAPLDVGKPVAWNRDPVTGIEAPCTYGKALNYRDDLLVGNVKFTWELGRHQHLVPLAVAYVISGDLRYRAAVVEQIDSWIEQNPFGMGIHWCTSLEASLRLISWSVVHSLFVLRDGKEGLFASIRDSKRLGDVIFQQAYFVRHFLSRYSSANNHLIGELAGLCVACQVFDLGEKGKEWSNFARQELESESVRQVYADGVNKEQAFYYHLWVLEYFLFVWMTGARSGQHFSDAFVERVLSMARFLEDVSPEGGEPPQIGDADDGFVTRFEPVWPGQPYRELLDAVRHVFNGAGPVSGQKAFWYHEMVPAEVRNLPEFNWQRAYPATYPEGGYVVMGGDARHLVFDAGALGYLGIAAHGHADALSFTLAVDGHWWLVDAGTYAYHSDPEWRSYFRGTAAHNTLRVNQADQSEIAGPFMWSRKANAWLDEVTESDGIQVVRAHHDGYAQLGVVHHRELRLSASGTQLDIIDRLEGAGTATKLAEIYYHFAPEVDIEPGPEGHSWIASCKGRRTQLLICTDPDWSYSLLKGSTQPIAGWYSPALEEKVPSCTLRGVAPRSGSLASKTKIIIK